MDKAAHVFEKYALSPERVSRAFEKRVVLTKYLGAQLAQKLLKAKDTATRKGQISVRELIEIESLEKMHGNSRIKLKRSGAQLKKKYPPDGVPLKFSSGSIN
jgi:hypothetical protein